MYLPNSKLNRLKPPKIIKGGHQRPVMITKGY